MLMPNFSLSTSQSQQAYISRTMSKRCKGANCDLLSGETSNSESYALSSN